MANRYLKAAGGVWTATGTTCWSATSSSGEDNAAPPTASDAAILDSGSGNVTISAASVGLSMNCTGYTGTITLNSTLTLSGSCTLSATTNMTTSGGGELRFAANATLTTNGVVIPGGLRTNSNYTITLGSDATCTGSLTQVGTTSSTFNGYSLTIGGGISTAGDLSGTTNLILNGSGTVGGTGSGDEILNNLEINTTGVIIFDETYCFKRGGVLAFTAGTVTGPMRLSGNTTVQGSGVWHTLSVMAASTITLGSNIYMQHCTVYGDNVVFNNYSLSISGNLTLSVAISGSSHIYLTGSGTWSASTATSIISNNLTIDTEGAIIFSAARYMTGTLTNTAGTVSGTLLIKGSCSLSGTNSFGGISNDIAGTITLNSDINIIGGFLVNSVATVLNGNRIFIAGNLTCNASLSGTSEIHLVDDSTWSGSSSATSVTNPIVLNAPGKTIVCNTGYKTGGSITNTAGYVSGSIIITGSTTLSGSNYYPSITTGSAATTITLESNITSLFTLTLGVNTVINGEYNFSVAGVTGQNYNISGTSTLVLIDGTLVGTGYFYTNITINAPNNNVLISGNINYSTGTFTYIDGKVNSSGVLYLTGNGTLQLTGCQFNTITINEAGTYNINCCCKTFSSGSGFDVTLTNLIIYGGPIVTLRNSRSYTINGTFFVDGGIITSDSGTTNIVLSGGTHIYNTEFTNVNITGGTLYAHYGIVTNCSGITEVGETKPTDLCIDPTNGSDILTSMPWGWWSVSFTGGTGTEPSEGTTVTGGTSTSTAKVSFVDTRSGAWNSNDAAGIIYFYGKSDTFVSEQVNFSGGHFDITTDFTYCAWKTIHSGAIQYRADLTDTLKILKSQDPQSLGSCSWIKGSANVILSSAETEVIDNCDSAWTAVSGTSVTTTTPQKQGTQSIRITAPSTTSSLNTQLNVKYAYKTLSSPLDLTSYGCVSFWMKSSVAISDGTYKICLCSDSDGNTPVDSFFLPNTYNMINQWGVVTLKKDGGGSLSNGINSIALYCNLYPPTPASYLYLDHIIATKLNLNGSNGLCLNSLISKNSSSNGGDEAWYGIQSIVGTTISLDTSVTATPSTSRVYGGVSGSATTYYRNPHFIWGNIFCSPGFNGSESNSLNIQGGYDNQTNLQNGDTFGDGGFGFGSGIDLSSKSYININRISALRFNYGLYTSTTSYCTIQTITSLCNNTLYGMYLNGSSKNNFGTIIGLNNNGTSGLYALGTSTPSNIVGGNNFTKIGWASGNGNYGIHLTYAQANIFNEIINISYNTGYYGIYFYQHSSDNIFKNVGLIQNNVHGINFNDNSNNNIIKNATIINNTAYGISVGSSTIGCMNNHIYYGQSSGNSTAFMRIYSHDFYLHRFTINETTKFITGGNVSSTYRSCKVYCDLVDDDPTNTYVWMDDGSISGTTNSEFHGDTTSSYYLKVNSYLRAIYNPLTIPIAVVPVSEGSTVTISVWIKLSSDTLIGAKLLIEGFQVDGVDSDVEDTALQNTDWQELTVQVSPTQKGVIEVKVLAWRIGTTNADAYAYFSDMSIS